MDPTRDYAFYGDANLAEYLRRPVRIAETNWTISAGSFQLSVDPWTSFLEDANVRNRVEGYRLLQGTMHLRIAINGGPFFYGRALAAYEPRHTENQHSFASTTDEAYVQQLTMLPHVFLDPTSSEGGEIVCPFLCPDDWIDLVGGTYDQMGLLRLVSINDLLHANATSGTVNISIYAWMDNVRLAAPTTVLYKDFDAHSGEEGASIEPILGNSKYGAQASLIFSTDLDPIPETEVKEVFEAHAGDEYGTGIISKPASTVAKAAGMLAKIPVIKPFALPTQMVSDTVGRIAHLFGYSRPAIVSDLVKSKLKGTGHLANTDAHEAVAKLSLDSKQELSIDPRTVGLSDVDEMSFDYIKQKECYMSTMTWTELDGSGTNLGRMIVGPDYHNTTTLFSNTLSILAPMYSIAVPFKYWRGSIKLRFQIVASQLHRGRLRFWYDPTFTSTTDPGENTVYSRIIDLATNRDFEMVVSWNQAKGWSRLRDTIGLSTYNHSGAGPTVYSRHNHNGTVFVDVVNELTSPDPTLGNPVYINCFVSAGPDFEVACPQDNIMDSLEWEPQSGSDEIPWQWFEPHSGEGEEIIDDVDDIPESPQNVTSVGTPEAAASYNSHVYFGERFASVRALLKRYCFHMAMASGTSNMFYWIESNFPVEPGQSVSPRHITGSGATPASTPYNYSNMTYLNWFVPHFVGWKGGLRSKYVPFAEAITTLAVKRGDIVDQSICGVYDYNTATANGSTLAQELLSVMGNGAGSDVAIREVDGSAEIEFPFYANKRFAVARTFLAGNDPSNTRELDHQGQNQGHIGFYMAKDADSNLLRYVAAGDDFSCFMFIGSPPVYKRTKPSSGTALTLPTYI